MCRRARVLVLLGLQVLDMTVRVGGLETHLVKDGRTVLDVQPPAGHVFLEEPLDMMLIVQNMDERRAEGAIISFQVVDEQTKAHRGGASGLLDGFQEGRDFYVPVTLDVLRRPCFSSMFCTTSIMSREDVASRRLNIEHSADRR